MGRLKDRMIHEDDLGCSLGSDKAVCTKCIEDKELAEVVRANPTDEACSFCGKKRKEVGEFSSVVERIALALNLDYSKPEEELFRDRESDTGWAGNIMDISEVLNEVDFETADWSIMEEIHSAFSDRQFCDRDYGLMRPNERRRAGWERFKRAVKHQRRYTFWSMGDDDNEPDHPDSLPVGEMLEEVGKIIREADMITEVEEGDGFLRVRAHETGKPFKRDSELSPPPEEFSVQANRMSPAGVPMFYGSEDWLTACVETVEPTNDPAKSVSGGRFRAMRSLMLLDLIDIPKPPSYFDIEQRELRLGLLFLRQFAHDLAKPIERNDRAHIEYVPTQAFTEYVRFQMKTDEGKAIDGIRYRSSRNGKPCVVLFCGQDECVEEPNAYGVTQWLSLEASSVKTVKVKDIKGLKPKVSKGAKP
jgi:hypothetical protein